MSVFKRCIPLMLISKLLRDVVHLLGRAKVPGEDLKGIYLFRWQRTLQNHISPDQAWP